MNARTHPTVPDALAAAARSGCGVRAIEHDGRRVELPYDALLAGALRIAGGLHASGLGPSAHVALVTPDVAGFVQAFFGIAAAGLVPVPLYPPAQARDVETFTRQSRHVLAASRAAAVITTPDIAPLLGLADLDRSIPALTIDALASGDPLPAPIAVDPSSPGLLQFTSGSTAAPKGVVLTHANLEANVAAIVGGLAVRPGDVGVSWLPLYHDMGLIGMLLSAVYCAANAVIMSPVLFLKRPTAWLEAIAASRGTISFAPNFAYDLCVRRVKPSQIEALDLSCWRVAGCGAEPVRADTLRAFAECFAPAGFRASSFVPSYGLAEHTVAVTFGHGLTVDHVDADRLVRESVAAPVPDRQGHVARLVSCGRPFAGHALRIVDDEGRELPERHVGGIEARGPSVMAGYFDDPDATAEARHDGWLRTGDLGYLAGGELFVCGRTKDLIIRQGRKYHPPDLEAAIADLRGVRTSAVVVFGLHHADEPDQVVAVLEARGASASDLEDQVRRRIRETAGLELDRIVVAPPGTIPRTTSGKVRRAETRARFRAGTLVARADAAPMM